MKTLAEKTKVEKVSIALTPEMAAMLRDAVDTGEYASSSEVVREALRNWKTERLEKAAKLADLRRLVEDAHASGTVEWDGITAFLARARKVAGD